MVRVVDPLLMDRVLGSQRPSEHVVEKGKELRDDLGLCILRITDISKKSSKETEVE